MNNTEMLQAAIKDDPANEILAWMLRDALVEERGFLMTEAAHHVETYVRAMQWHADVERVSKWLSATSKYAEGIRDEIVRIAKVDLTEDSSIVLCLGPYVPTPHRDIPPAEEGYWPQVTITVGATWLLQHYADRAMLFDQTCRAIRLPKRKRKT